MNSREEKLRGVQIGKLFKKRRNSMRKKLISLLFVPGFLAASLFCTAHAQEGTKPAAPMKTVKIGIIAPQSGPLAFYGISVLRGVELAMKTVNEKGTVGNGPGILVGKERYRLEPVVYDDSGDPAKSVPGMRKLVEMYNIPVMMGPFGTPQATAAQGVNVGLKVLFNGMSTSDAIRKRGNPLYIQERAPGLYFGEPMAQACISKGYKKAAVLTDINEAYVTWGKRFSQEFERLGGKVVASESVDIKHTTDYHSIMTSFKAKNPDIIFITMYEEAMALAASHAVDGGYSGKFLFNSEWGTKAEKILPLSQIEGSFVETMVWNYYRIFPDQDKKGYVNNFLKQYAAIYKEDFGLPAITSYDPQLMFARAMELSNSVTDAYAIRAACPKALEEGKLPLLNPNNDVLKNGLMVGAPELLLEVKGGQYKFVRELRISKSLLE
jgi:branched-chain amino acid transport system substrate-binding protein